MKKFIILLAIVAPGCVREPAYYEHVSKKSQLDEDATYSSLLTPQARIAEELTKIRQILEKQEHHYEKD